MSAISAAMLVFFEWYNSTRRYWENLSMITLSAHCSANIIRNLIMKMIYSGGEHRY